MTPRLPSSLSAVGGDLLAASLGLVVAGLVALAASAAAPVIGLPAVVLALVAGLGTGALLAAVRPSAADRLAPGLAVATRPALQLGIVLMGLTLRPGEVAALGPVPFALMVAGMAATLAAGVWAGRRWGDGWQAGVLGGAATAICGASAALATHGVLTNGAGPAATARADRALAATLVTLTLASAAAMLLIPLAATALGLDARAGGYWAGAAIHDVAQALGGGAALGPAAGAVAAIVKLARVALLAPLLLGLAWWLRRQAADAGGEAGGAGPATTIRPPWFVTGFVLLLAAQLVWTVPPGLAGVAKGVSGALLLLAIAATGLRVRVGRAGWRAWAPAAAPVLAASVVAAGAGLAGALILTR